MKKFTLIKLILCLIELTMSRYVWSMENYFNTLPNAVIRSIFSLTDNEQYPNKKQSSIFSCFYRLDDEEKKAALKTIHMIITIRNTCKKFRHKVLGVIPVGKMLKKYSIQMRNELLHDVIWNKEKAETLQSMIPCFYNSKRSFACSLLYSGTDFGKKSHDKLVNSALHNNDIEVISFLCQRKKIRLNELSENETPLFFEARTVEMAQLCEKIVDIYAAGSDSCPNVLWKVVANNDMPAKLLQFYLEKDIAIFPRESDGNSLLHELAIASSKDVKNINDFLQKAKFLLEKEPELIYDCNYAGETPSDCAANTLTVKNYFLNTTEPAKRFIELLEGYSFSSFII